jgi:hypothetical protein
VYMDLTSPAVLERCLKKRTQNPNETVYTKLWLRCLKVKNSPLDRVKFTAADTVLTHNFGPARGGLLIRMGLSNEATEEALQRTDTFAPSTTSTPKRPRLDPPGPVDDPGEGTSYASGSF